MGENGAGKSTLIKVITGVEHPDHGAIEFDGKKVEVHSPQHAQQIGISTVYQEINLCTNISVAENIMLGHEPKAWFGGIHWRKMNQMAAAGPKAIGNRYRCHQTAGKLFGRHPANGRHRPLAWNFPSAKVLILDEPTSSLDVNETNQLFEVMRRLKRPGHWHHFYHPLPGPGLPGGRPDHCFAQWKTGGHV